MLVQVQEEFAIIILVPREFRVDGYFLDSAMPQQLFFQLLAPISQFIVIISVHLHPEATRTLTDIVTEALVLQAKDSPTTTTQVQCLADDIRLQGIRESAILMLLGEIYLNSSPTGTIDGSLELLDFLELRQIRFHLLHQYIHLFQSTSVRQGSRNGKHRFAFVPIEVTARIDLINKKTQASAQCLVHDRLHLLLVSRIVEHLIIIFRPYSLTFHFLRQEEYRKSESQHQQHTSHHPIPAHPTNQPDVKAAETNDGTFEPKRRSVFLFAYQLYLFNHGRYKEESHEQGHQQIDDDYGRKVLQVQPQLVVQEEDNDQCPDSGQCSCQYRDERL